MIAPGRSIFRKNDEMFRERKFYEKGCPEILRQCGRITDFTEISLHCSARHDADLSCDHGNAVRCRMAV
jgi:hypothetical protein